MKINYLVGDATNPEVSGPKVIVHVCNDIGAWGAGFVMALSKKWSEPEAEYRRWYAIGDESFLPFKLGTVQPVFVGGNTLVINMIAQHETIKTNSKPLDYEALFKCLKDVRPYALFGDVTEGSASVHMPRIGCGLAGGNWEVVEAIIEKTLDGLDVYVYDLA